MAHKYQYVKPDASVSANYGDLHRHMLEFQNWVRADLLDAVHANQADLEPEEKSGPDEIEEIRGQIERLDDAVSEAVGALSSDGDDAAEFLNDYV